MSIYESYGKLMIQKEILEGQILEVKKAIALDMQKPKEEDKK